MKNCKEKRTRISALIAALLMAFSGTAAYADDADGAVVEIKFYADAEKTQPLLADALPTDEYVYYELVADDGYYCKKLLTNAAYTDEEKLLIGDAAELSARAMPVLAGDANGDGAVTAADLTRIMKWISRDPETYHLRLINIYAANNNGDGVLDTKDLTRAMKIIAGVSLELPTVQSNFVAASKQEYLFEPYYAASEDGHARSLCVINSTEELLLYIDKAEQDFDTETPFQPSEHIAEESRDDELILQMVAEYEARHLRRETLLEKYDEAFFEEHSLLVHTNRMEYTTFLGAELRGDTLAVLFRDVHLPGFSLIDYLYVQEFIELPKLSESVSVEMVYQYWD